VEKRRFGYAAKKNGFIAWLGLLRFVIEIPLAMFCRLHGAGLLKTKLRYHTSEGIARKMSAESGVF
jgi:hypothetical protein